MAYQLSTADRIMKAKMDLLLDEPFFGTLLLRMKVLEDPDGIITKTMATNGRVLFWHGPYVDKIPDVQLRGLLAHEVMHVANGHCLRRGARDHHKFNLACDAAIDHILADAGFDVPNTFTKHHEYDFAKGLAAEVIYDQLPEPPKQQGQGQGGGQGQGPQPQRPGGVLDSPALQEGQAAVSQEEGENKIAVKQAAMLQTSKKKGNTPGWMKALVEDICEVKIPWQQVLRRFVTDTIPKGQTWGRPNRRFVHMGQYLPGTLKSGIGEMVIYCDSSGSCISEFPQFFAEMNAIIDELTPEKVHVVLCDTKVGSFTTYEPGDKLNYEVIGMGGSDFRPAFKEVADRDLQPMVAVVLSDMIIDFPEDAPDYPVIAISTTDHEGPKWAENIRMN